MAWAGSRARRGSRSGVRIVRLVPNGPRGIGRRRGVRRRWSRRRSLRSGHASLQRRLRLPDLRAGWNLGTFAQLRRLLRRRHLVVLHHGQPRHWSALGRMCRSGLLVLDLERLGVRPDRRRYLYVADHDPAMQRGRLPLEFHMQRPLHRSRDARRSRARVLRAWVQRRFARMPRWSGLPRMRRGSLDRSSEGMRGRRNLQPARGRRQGGHPVRRRMRAGHEPLRAGSKLGRSVRRVRGVGTRQELSPRCLPIAGTASAMRSGVQPGSAPVRLRRRGVGAPLRGLPAVDRRNAVRRGDDLSNERRALSRVRSLRRPERRLGQCLRRGRQPL